MTPRFRRLARLFSCLLTIGIAAYAAEPAKTVVADTIYRADGSPASGTMMITWPAFVTGDGKPVAAGSKTVKIGADGAVNIPLVPTQGATPAGTYYKIVLSLDDGASSQEYWTVPTLSPTSIAAIRSSVVPATVAMQVVSREYVDGAVANTVRKTGDESIDGTKSFSSSPLVPSPTAPTAAANKDYVDVSVAAAVPGSGTLALNKGGTGQTTWTSARCVRVANNGASLESAPGDCNSNADMLDGLHAASFQLAMANAGTLSKVAESGGNPLWNGSAWPAGFASNADMVDGLHAASFQTAMANAATLSKIAESGGNPLWNGSAWPGGGGAGNATQIQGKAVDTPDSARQIEVYDGATAFKKWQDPVVRMNRDCGIVGSGDETAALNTCIANLPNYTGVLQCDKPGMAIQTTGVVVRDKVGIRIETATGGHTLNFACQLIYTGSAGGTVVDVERTRNSVIFKGFKVSAGAADVAFQTGQTGSGTNIATGDWFEELQVSNNNGRSTFVGFRIGDSTNQNSDEMSFLHVYVTSSSCTKCGTAFLQYASFNVYGTQFRDIILTNLAIGWDWSSAASIDKVNGYDVALLYKLNAGNDQTFHVKNEDMETVDQILQITAGSNSFIEERGRIVLRVPGQGGVTGTAGHPAWDFSGGGGNRSSIKNMVLGTASQLVGLTFLSGTANIAALQTDFYDPGCNTFAYAECAPGNNALNMRQPSGFLAAKGTAPGVPWVGRGFIDAKGMVVPSEGMLQQDNGGLSQNHTPCSVGSLCLWDGQVELTGIHSILNNPTIGYTGTAGSTTRTYALIACSDTACAVGNRSVPSIGAQIQNTASTLDGSHYVTLTWTPALGVNKYGILQSNPSDGASPPNLLMSNISCSTNPCTVNITTDSSTYTTAYPADNETGGVILRGAIKMGKSATQPAVIDYTYASASPNSLNQWPQYGWAATASSTSGGGFEAAKGIDGTTGTYWVSSTDGPPWTYDVNLGAPYALSGLTVSIGASVYRVLNYEVYVSSDGATWGYPVASGSWPNDASVKTATWPPVLKQYLRLKALSSADVKVAIEELNLYAPVQAVASNAVTLNGKHAGDFLAAATQLPLTKTCTGTDKVSAYDASTGALTCSADQTGAGGSGISSLNGASQTSQTFVDGANIHVATNTGTGAHTIAVTGLGDAAAKNTGATAGTVAAGDDSRFTNARTPTAHASTHQNGGSDEIATATAAANAIPKAGAGGTLGAAWIPDLSATYLPLHSTADLAAGLSAPYTDWNAGSGGASIQNKPALGTAAAKNVLGTGSNVATTSASAPASNKCVEFDSNGNLVVAGNNLACGAGGSMAWPAAAGIAVYGGSSAWGTSIPWNSGTNTMTGNITGNAGGTAAGFTGNMTGDVTSSGMATTLRTGLNVRTCELHIWGTGTNSLLQDTDDEVASCFNKYGVTWTITHVGCWANVGSPTVMIAKTGGNNVLAGNLTCGAASWAAGSLTATAADKQTADGGTVDVNIVSAGGTATNIRVVIAGTI